MFHRVSDNSQRKAQAWNVVQWDTSAKSLKSSWQFWKYPYHCHFDVSLLYKSGLGSFESAEINQCSSFNPRVSLLSDNNAMTRLHLLSSLQVPRKVSVAASCELQKWKFNGDNMRKDELKTKFVKNAVFCVSAMFFIFPGWDLAVSHSLTTQCYLPWLFSCLADTFLPPDPAPHAVSF